MLDHPIIPREMEHRRSLWDILARTHITVRMAFPLLTCNSLIPRPAVERVYDEGLEDNDWTDEDESDFADLNYFDVDSDAEEHY